MHHPVNLFFAAVAFVFILGGLFYDVRVVKEMIDWLMTVEFVDQGSKIQVTVPKPPPLSAKPEHRGD